MAWLTTERGAREFRDGETVVGSGPRANWRLDGIALTPKHFVIRKRDGRMTLRAANVDSVVALNGKRTGTSEVELRDGDMIDAGTARFAFSPIQAPPAKAVEVPAAHIVETRGGYAYELRTPVTRIGRDRSNEIVVRDPTASRFHAEIRREAGGYMLHPRGSSGTQINGHGISAPEQLMPGDRMEIGHVELRFEAGLAPEGAPRPPRGSADELDRSERRTMVASAVLEVTREAPRRQSSAWIWVVLALVVGATLYLGLH